MADDLVFIGLFETYKNPDEYLKALTGLMQVTVRLDPKSVFGENENAAIFFELETKTPVEAVTFVAEWHQVERKDLPRPVGVRWPAVRSHVRRG